MMQFAVVILLSIASHTVSASSGVPVLLWGSDGSTGRLPIPLAGHSLQSDAFKRDYLDSVMPCKGCDGHNVLVFLREKLSMDDVTKFGDVYSQDGHGGSFNNIKSYMEKDDSLSLSSVSNVLEGLDYLKGQFGQNIHLLNSLSEVEAVPFNKESRLIVVHLAEDHSLPMEKRLAANDAFIGSVVKSLEARKVPYTALLTAKSPSTHQKDANTLAGASSRHLLADVGASSAVAINITDCFLMYYTSMNLSMSEVNSTTKGVGAPIPITGEPATDGSICSQSGAAITLKYTVTGQKFSTLTIKMSAKPSPYQDWAIENMTLSIGAEEVPMSTLELGGPITFSYACGLATIKSTRAVKDENMFLTIVAFQVQAFSLDGGKFGYPNDCTPFFTIGILSGLIITLLLITILSFGIMMVASITTMDRFDDPKGKQLNINVQETK